MPHGHAGGRINARDRKFLNPKFTERYGLYIQYVTTANLHKKGGLVVGYRPPVFRRSVQFEVGYEFTEIVRKTPLPTGLRGIFAPVWKRA